MQRFNGKTSVVFCGVNWSAQQYGLPTSNVTGIIEVLPMKENLQQIKISTGFNFPSTGRLETGTKPKRLKLVVKNIQILVFEVY